MKLRTRTTIAVAGVTAAIAAGAGGAFAAAGGSGHGPGGSPAAIATYLGLTEDGLRAQLESGKTLAQVASAQGKSVSGLEDVIYADVKAHLDRAVADGKLAAGQEQTMLADLKSHLDDIVNNSGPRLIAKGVHGGPFGHAAADYLGLTPAELRAQLESGKTLAQVAADRGKSVDGLKAAILAGAKKELDAAVAAGRITSAREQAMLDELTSHVDDLVNGAGRIRVAAAA